MKKLMYVVACILALGFVACGSDDDKSIDCAEANVTLTDAAIALSENIGSTDVCNDYKAAIENVLNNGCAADEESTKLFEEQLEILGDCKFGGRTCLVCTNEEIDLIICRGENGNAFIQEKIEGQITLRDTGVTFDRYVELSACD
ncbi:hypothetical protein [Aquimarina aquimarini]|uniref:hypothetical protein n=1 Tax=Aquimarina aquimarini TaxID=1191734 RepID=UPI000D5567AC|nr:hypothetical protein [Aquimarina aquimarini]